MAVQSTRVNTALSLKYKTGIDASGNDILKTKRFSNVKVIAPDQNIFDTAAALSSLLKYEVTDVVRNDDNLIIGA
jgi:hypothetical protein